MNLNPDPVYAYMNVKVYPDSVVLGTNRYPSEKVSFDLRTESRRPAWAVILSGVLWLLAFGGAFLTFIMWTGATVNARWGFDDNTDLIALAFGAVTLMLIFAASALPGGGGEVLEMHVKGQSVPLRVAKFTNRSAGQQILDRLTSAVSH